MNENVMHAIYEMSEIRHSIIKEYMWKEASMEPDDPKRYSGDDEKFEEFVLKEYALEYRARLLDVIRHFYYANSDSQAGTDDFVTLFGAYCNQYIWFNLHQVLPDEDRFGIQELWDTITDEKMQKYLALLQQGIFKGIYYGYSCFKEASSMFPYSLPNLYLFLEHAIALREFLDNMTTHINAESLIDGNRTNKLKEEKRKMIYTALGFYKSLNSDLQNYCLGNSIYCEEGDAMHDPSPVPFIKVWDKKGHDTFEAMKQMEAIANDLENLVYNSLDEEMQFPEITESVLKGLVAIQEIAGNAQGISSESLLNEDGISEDDMNEEDISDVNNGAKYDGPSSNVGVSMEDNYMDFSSNLDREITMERIDVEDYPDVFLANNMDISLKIKGGDTTSANMRNSDNRWNRKEFLSIPFYVNWGEGANVYAALLQAAEEQSKAKEKEQKEKEAIQQEKDEIVQDFSHTYQNMTATALYQVAIALLSRTTEEDLALGRTALLEYTRKETLTKDVYMMKLKYENNTEKLRSILRQSCKFPSPEMHTIHEVANQALLTALISAFYDEGQGNAVAMFDNLNMFWPSMEEIVLSFEKEVIQHETDCLEWLQTKGIDLCMEESEQWMSIGFVPNGYAEVLLRNLITELFVNFFKYGDQKQKVLLSFQGDNSTYDSLHIRMENFLLNGKRGTSNSQVGLHAMSKMLRVLWDDREEKKRIVTDYVDDKFITRLWLPLAVFQQRGEEK